LEGYGLIYSISGQGNQQERAGRQQMGKASKRQLSKRELAAPVGCVYCGKALTADTVRLDHVFPRCLFPSSSGVTFMELPACNGCNQEKSKYDSLLRDMAVMAKGSLDHPVARELSATVRRSIEKNKSEAF
jgi:5-methylcytosine-specific restriction endonuclease McrA